MEAALLQGTVEAASKDAGITDLHFHDLRGTAVTLLAEAGCTTPQIAAITGHSLETVTKILDKIPRPHSRTRWRGCRPVRERKSNQVCKLLANQSIEALERNV